MILLVLQSIKPIRGGAKGCSRQAIANYLIANNGKKAGSAFNAHLRNALKKCIEGNLLKYGQTQQRFKLGDNAKSITNPPKKKKIVKKTASSKKKKDETKTKKVASKKKVVSKKKKVSKKLFFLVEFIIIFYLCALKLMLQENG